VTLALIPYLRHLHLTLPAELMSRVDLCLHGQVHDSCDYKTHGTRVAAGGVDDLQAFAFENMRFDAGLLINI
jgi:hypothetical protein